MFYIIVKITKGSSLDSVLTANLYMYEQCLVCHQFVDGHFILMYRGWSTVKEVPSLTLTLR